MFSSFLKRFNGAISFQEVNLKAHNASKSLKRSRTFKYTLQLTVTQRWKLLFTFEQLQIQLNSLS